MDKNDIVAGVKHFLWDVIRFEKKKLILPSLAVLIILAAVFLGSHLRSQGVDEHVFSVPADFAADSTVISMEHREFNDSLEGTYDLRMEELRQDVENYQFYRHHINGRQIRVKGAVTLALLVGIYDTPFFPVAPAGTFPHENLYESDKALLFTVEDGYVLSEHAYEVPVLVPYRQAAITDLAERANRTDMTLQEFRQEVEGIKSHGPQSEEVKMYVEENIDNLESDKRRNISRMAVNGELKEVGLVHFIPAMIVAFAWNYLVSGFIIASFRFIIHSIRNFVSRLSSDPKNGRKQVNQQGAQENRQYQNNRQGSGNNRQYNNQQGRPRSNNLQNNRRRNNR